jgi:hypothetical protein
MNCSKCGKEIEIPNIVYRNLETYNVGGIALTVSKCCNAAYLVKMIVKFGITDYIGDKKEDDWGNKIKK